MVITKNLLFASSASLLRGVTAFFFLVVAARLLGVEAFGVFSFAFTVASVFGLAVDYGFQVKILRDIARDYQAAGEIVAKVLQAKALLFFSSFVLLLFCVYNPLGGFSKYFSSEAIPLLFGYSINSATLILSAPYKIKNRYEYDFLVSLIDVVMLALALLLAIRVGVTSGVLSIAFVAAKIFTFVVCLLLFGLRYGFSCSDLRSIVKEIKRCGPYAAHIVLGILYVNVDVFVIKGFVTDFDFGIYQAGMRLVLGSGVLLTIINSVFIPRFADFVSKRNTKLRSELLLILAILCIPSFLGCYMAHVFGNELSLILYGAEYHGLGPLLWLFCVLIVMRVFGALLGVILTVSGRQVYRVIVGAIALIGVMALDLYIVPRSGIWGAVNVQLLVHASVLLMYGAFVISQFNALGDAKLIVSD